MSQWGTKVWEALSTISPAVPSPGLSHHHNHSLSWWSHRLAASSLVPSAQPITQRAALQPTVWDLQSRAVDFGPAHTRIHPLGSIPHAFTQCRHTGPRTLINRNTQFELSFSITMYPPSHSSFQYVLCCFLTCSACALLPSVRNPTKCCTRHLA